MTLPFTLNTAQEWLDNIPSFLVTLDASSEYSLNNEIPEYIASTLMLHFNHSPRQFGEKILFILENASDSGKLVFLKTLLLASEIWSELVVIEGFEPMITELALTTEKIFSNIAIELSKKLEELTSEVKRDIKFEESILAPGKSTPDGFNKSKSLEDLTIDQSNQKAKKLASILSPTRGSAPKSQPLPPIIKESKPTPPPPAPAPSMARAPSPPPPAPVPVPVPASEPITGGVPPSSMDSIKREETKFELEEEEELAEIEKSYKEVESRKKKMKREALSETISTDSSTKDSKQLFTHVHYFNRMNSHKIYPFTVSLSSSAKKVRMQRIGNILSGEREAETQAEFELDAHTRQIMVEPLISGCLVQPTFQYIDPDKLPTELTFYITPLVESGLQATKLQGFLIIKSELGTILQKLPLSDIYVVSNRISKLAAIVGTIGGASLPVLDFLFPLGLQNALSDQLTYTLPEIANSINIRELLTVGQISIFVLCIGFGLLWYWRKGRSKLAPRERLSINL